MITDKDIRREFNNATKEDLTGKSQSDIIIELVDRIKKLEEKC